MFRHPKVKVNSDILNKIHAEAHIELCISTPKIVSIHHFVLQVLIYKNGKIKPQKHLTDLQFVILWKYSRKLN